QGVGPVLRVRDDSRFGGCVEVDPVRVGAAPASGGRMSTARDYLAAVQRRADRKVLWPAMSPEKANDLVAALNDRRRLVAALTAVLDLAETNQYDANQDRM